MASLCLRNLANSDVVEVQFCVALDSHKIWEMIAPDRHQTVARGELTMRCLKFGVGEADRPYIVTHENIEQVGFPQRQVMDIFSKNSLSIWGP